MASDNMDLLQNFLYLGTNSNVIRGLHISKYPFDPVNVECLENLINDGHGIDTVDEIVRFHKEGWFLRSDALTYSLAFCAHSKDAGTRRAAFSAAGDICKSASEMFAFVQFYKDISKPTSGWGRAHRNFLINWYNGKDAKELATEVLKVKSRYKWTHKDILCMTHVKPKDASTAVVLRYILKGIESAEKDFGSEAEAESVLKYLKVIDQLKHTSDIQAAARLIEIHDLSHEYLPTQIFKSKEIWYCLIPRLPLHTLLEKLPLLYKLGLLKLDSPHYKLLMERLTPEAVLTDAKVSPLETFTVLCRLQQASKELSRKPNVRPNPLPPALDDALQNLHSVSFKTVPTTKRRYLVVLDRRIPFIAKKCFSCSSVYASQISYVILMSLAKSELSNVTTVASSADGIVPVDVDNNMTLQEIYQRLDKVLSGTVIPTAPLQWAKENKKAFDLILVLTDLQPQQKDEEIIAALKDYRQNVNVPDARYALCAFSTAVFSESSPLEHGFLKIGGLNMKLLKIIQDFASHVF